MTSTDPDQRRTGVGAVVTVWVMVVVAAVSVSTWMSTLRETPGSVAAAIGEVGWLLLPVVFVVTAVWVADGAVGGPPGPGLGIGTAPDGGRSATSPARA